MATYRKRNGKWQAIVRHKTIGTISRSFHTKQAAIKWVISVEEQLESGTFGTLRLTHITLGELLERYSCEVTPTKRGATTELRRLQRLIRDPVSGFRASQLTSQAVAVFRDRRLLDGRRTCHYDLILIRHCLKIAINEWGLVLSSKAAQVLTKQRQRNDTPSPFPVTPNGFSLAWGRLRSRAGLSDLRFHDLRHEAISRFFELGLNISEVAVISGHKDPKMLFRYTHLRAEELVSRL